MPRGMDNDDLNADLLLSLPMREGAGILRTADVAKPHHPIVMTNPPAWATIASGLGVLDFDGSDYMDCAAASCADLDFTNDDFSLACWVYWEGVSSDIIAGRYVLDASGWEMYLDDTDPLRTLTLRFHHGGVPTRTACYSLGWTKSIWWLLGISRSGAYPLHYRNGLEVEASYSAGGLTDPVTSANDLVIGARYDHSANLYDGKMQGLRIWERKLEPWEHREIFHRERALFGV